MHWALNLFQSTPPHGRRRDAASEPPALASFNPRLRTGGDPRLPHPTAPGRVSIHASAREATRPTDTSLNAPPSFNPRLRTGGDLAPTSPRGMVKLFQSTPPHGRRPVRHEKDDDYHVFQSTPPHGRRLWVPTEPSVPTGFNPRLRTGGDYLDPLVGTTLTRFQSTPPHGRRRTARRSSRHSLSFNPRLRTGGDEDGWRVPVKGSWFQSTPPHGRRPIAATPVAGLPCFNPRLRTGGDRGREASPHRQDVSIHASAREATEGDPK